MNLCNNFEKAVFQGLENCGVNVKNLENSNEALGIAVSGGADSVSLLISLLNIFKTTNVKIKVITINHYIRKDEETCGDVQFVVDLCEKLKKDGFNLDCFVHEIPRGKIESLSKKNKGGIEEAARVLRYEAFENFIEQQKIAFLCLAHNLNDKLETVLMRFLQGSFCESSAGIPQIRDKYIRPLLNVSRKEIEAYLEGKKQEYRTDKSNFDNNYLRNKIRNNLVPFLDENFNGWQKGVLTGARKNEIDKNIIENEVNKTDIKFENGMGILNRKDFNKLEDGIKIRVLLKAVNLCGFSQRIPFVFLEDIVKSEKENKNNKDFYKIFMDCVIEFKNQSVFVKKVGKMETELSFSAIIEEDCKIELPLGNISVLQSGKTVKFENEGKSVSVNCSYPLRIRNAYAGDEILNADGNLKKINDIFSDWHVDDSKKCLIPLVEDLSKNENKIICILGSFLGFKDWIVR